MSTQRPPGAGAVGFLAHNGGDQVTVAARAGGPGPATAAWLAKLYRSG